MILGTFVTVSVQRWAFSTDRRRIESKASSNQMSPSASLRLPKWRARRVVSERKAQGRSSQIAWQINVLQLLSLVLIRPFSRQFHRRFNTKVVAGWCGYLLFISRHILSIRPIRREGERLPNGEPPSNDGMQHDLLRRRVHALPAQHEVLRQELGSLPPRSRIRSAGTGIRTKPTSRRPSRLSSATRCRV